MPVLQARVTAPRAASDLRDGLVAMALALGASFGAGAGAIALADPAAMSLWFGDGSVLRPMPASRVAAASKPAGGARDKSVHAAMARVAAPAAPSAPARPAVEFVLRRFASLGFDLDSIRAGASRVPRLFLATLPEDLVDIDAPEKRKAVFIGTLLPLVLRVNENVLADREHVLGLRNLERKGGELEATDREWLQRVADRYGAANEDYATLLHHVDAIPPSMALAQAAEESGWGTSRFAAVGNALFGQRVWKRGAGIAPAERDQGARYEVRKFARLESSVAAYIHNLNSHPAYRDFRDQRASLRVARQPRQGAVLVSHLHRYSERGTDYVDTLRAIIRENDFGRYDSAQLQPPAQTPVTIAWAGR